jgi:hypothetical protein
VASVFFCETRKTAFRRRQTELLSRRASTCFRIGTALSASIWSSALSAATFMSLSSSLPQRSESRTRGGRTVGGRT